MKVVLFCGGPGTRLQAHAQRMPKPLVEVGPRPILWHLMKYYAHFGHNDFILCLGHGAAAIKDFFLNYDERMSTDFVLAQAQTQLLAKDIEDWTITFVDTGLETNVGERLRKVRQHLQGERMFLANYADELTDLDLRSYVQAFEQRSEIACFLSVPVPHTFYVVESDAEQQATKLEHVMKASMRINGGFFVFRSEIFDYLEPGQDLIDLPFQRLIDRKQLLAVPHDGFWRSMDTFKDKIELDELLARGRGPWQVWLHD